MPDPVDSPYLVPFDGSFRVADAPTAPPDDRPSKKRCRKELARTITRIAKQQRRLHAGGQHAVLLVFQAMDAGGKDGTIRALLTGVNPAGCRVHSFGLPTPEERAHDFLWRTTRRLPERGQLGVFNRSHYEEVLVARVHPELLEAQRLPAPVDPELIWDERFASIREHERHLARNGTVILKFWLNLSRAEQKRRFLKRIDDPHRHWKFDVSDVAERRRWDDYMTAYEAALNATSRPYAPWYAIPADHKPFLRMIVARLVADTLASLGLEFPEVLDTERERMLRLREALEQE